MNRRDFIRSFAAGVATVAIGMRVARGMPDLPLFDYAEQGRRTAQALAKSMMQTKEVITANVLNRAFDWKLYPYEGQATKLSALLDPDEWEFKSSGEGARRAAGGGGSPGRV